MTATARASFDAPIKAASKVSALFDRRQSMKIVGWLVDRDFAPPIADDLIRVGLSNEDGNFVEFELNRLQGKEMRMAFAVALSTFANQNQGPVIEVCWTGPRLEAPLRSTGPVIEEMIQQAERRIIIAEFDVTNAARPILNMIGERARTGVEVYFLADRAEEKATLMDWARATPGVEVWSRPLSPEDPIAKFHVKSILVDGKVGMFGSANLTRVWTLTGVSDGKCVVSLNS